MKICHITSAHRKNDLRIYYKECCSLSKLPDSKVFLVQQGESDDTGIVEIVGFGKIESNRFKRMIKTAKKAYKKACDIDADIYHIHDPELLPYAMKLKRKGKKVIFDSHEFNVGTIREKYYIPAAFRRIIAFAYGKYEAYVAKKIDGIVAATGSLADYFKKYNNTVETVCNFPILDEYNEPNYNARRLAFAGGINESWGHKHILDAISDINGVSYFLAGPCTDTYLNELKSSPGWSKADYMGVIPQQQVFNELTNSSIGMAYLMPNRDTFGKTGTMGNTKIFEEMMSGLPVICTNFTLWKEFIEKYDCGICIEFGDIDALKSAILYLINNPDECKRMGYAGRLAVEKEFNLSNEETKLLKFYSSIM